MDQPSQPISSPTDLAVAAAVKSTTIFYQALIDLDVFNKEHVQGVLTTLLSPTERDKCFMIPYHRGSLNVRSIIALNHASHFQAVTMLARNLFELSIEVRLIDVIPDAVHKMVVFHDLERLKAAKRATKFASVHTLQFPTNFKPYQQFIATKEQAILAASNALWGTHRISHWSGKDTAERVRLLDQPFAEIYHSLYKQFSWQVHSGLTGAVDMQPETFAYLFGVSCQIASISYQEIMKALITEFKLSSALPDIAKELDFAKLRAATNDNNQEVALRRALGLM